MHARTIASIVAAAAILAACMGEKGDMGGTRETGGQIVADDPGMATASDGPTPATTPSIGAQSRALPGPNRAWVISPIREPHRAVLVPRNWRPGCPVPLTDLRWLTIRYWGFDGETHRGPIVVNERVAEDVRWVFRQIFHARFPIKHITLPGRYRPKRDGWDTTRSVTAGFNCRPATGNPGVWSQHAYGLAIDINPLQNPYVRSNGSVLRRAAKPYRDRSLERLGMIRESDVVVRSFDAIGWGWGGRWVTLKDYMHFSLTGS